MDSSLKVYSVEEHVERLEDEAEFAQMMMWYRCALMEVETKLNVLNQEFSMYYDRNPFESIKCRIKSTDGIINKLQRKNLEHTIENVQRYIRDVAGIRVICSFQEDIYEVTRMLLSQDDVSVLEIKDYIKNPKPNGYRSLHVIIAIPIFLSNERKLVQVEVQFRTIAMDFWASLEHKLKYKKNVKESERIVERLATCAESIHKLDVEMQAIRHLIEKEG